ncbi:AraC family transcriptional regulator [Burkholderia sp. Ac-20353]|uniref:helix-turn-helix domain-containing protein n=1 Tax=Burkholderia sp. Ac-20353 TaxID=2703894 RepID=UPI00197C7F76|nr:AraC family transcriptional regulator [Burkholderia sp. Ac-20353]MBN3792048.1 helix-turn-helix transcriptional regulator [Burkholderia sp. Ac-20353]
MPGAMGSILASHLRSFHDNLAGLSAAQIPYLTQATTNLLLACLQTTLDTLMQADTEINAALLEAAKGYIEKNFTNPALSPEQICKAIGISRAKLYRLFEPAGGVMKLIQRKRLVHIRSILADPTRPKARIADIAWRHGFASDKHFSRSFKAEFGFSPRETIRQAFHQDDSRRLDRPQPGSDQVKFSDWATRGARSA